MKEKIMKLKTLVLMKNKLQMKKITKIIKYLKEIKDLFFKKK